MPPDLNVVSFIAVAKDAPDLARANELNHRIYKRFTIDAEHGDQHYSYGQPFFLSHTKYSVPEYGETAVRDLFGRTGLRVEHYASLGLFVLRASVMSSFHVMAAETGHRQSLLAEFVEALAAAMEEEILRDSNPPRATD